MKRISKWATNTLTALFAAGAVIFIISSINAYKHPGEVASIFGTRFMTVLSGSMEPAIKAGDMVVVTSVKPDQIKIGDIITYRVDNDFYITHRVSSISEENGEKVFNTKGDANNVGDNGGVTSDMILGLVKLRVPHGGYVVEFIKGPVGLMLFLVIPASLLIYGEVATIISAVKDEKKDKGKSEDV